MCRNIGPAVVHFNSEDLAHIANVMGWRYFDPRAQKIRDVIQSHLTQQERIRLEEANATTNH